MPKVPLALMSTAEVARRLRVSTRHVARLVDAGEITPVHRGTGPRGAYLFEEDEVLRVEDERRSQAHGGAAAGAA